MKNLDSVVKSVLEHPIASTVIIAVTLDGIAEIIKAARENQTKPKVKETV